MDHELIAEILTTLRTAYGDWTDYTSPACNPVPYPDFEDGLDEIFDEVIEYTDLNYDVSFMYLLTKGFIQWELRLSMAGPYAYFVRISTSSGQGAIADWMQVSCTEELQVLELLRAHGIKPLGIEELSYPIPLVLDHWEQEDVRVYHGLFLLLRGLPWEYRKSAGR